MIRFRLVSLVAFILGVAACAYPQPRPVAPGNPQPGGSPTDAVEAVGARVINGSGGKSTSAMESFEVGFHCLATLPNEVPNARLCRGIVFHVRDPNGKELSRLLPNEEGIFRFRGVAGEGYFLVVTNGKTWELQETGPFYAGRDYTIHVRVHP